jgi:hypothetical protein
MKRILCAVLITVGLTTPALAAKLYLKDGGVIQAKRVWRSDGKVHVLATRHTLTSFEPNEVNLKRTFPKKHRVARKTVAAAQPANIASVPATDNATPKAADKKNRLSLPELPKLPERSPESLVPSSGSGGTIKQHKKDMAERLGE